MQRGFHNPRALRQLSSLSLTRSAWQVQPVFHVIVTTMHHITEIDVNAKWSNAGDFNQSRRGDKSLVTGVKFSRAACQVKFTPCYFSRWRLNTLVTHLRKTANTIKTSRFSAQSRPMRWRFAKSRVSNKCMALVRMQSVEISLTRSVLIKTVRRIAPERAWCNK